MSAATEARLVIGTAAIFAVTAVLALAVGALARRSALTVTALLVVIVLPHIRATGSVLPTGAAEWLARFTPAAAFAVQQTLVAYPQVDADYSPGHGYFPLAPWAGFAVLCAWAALAPGLAYRQLLRRRTSTRSTGLPLKKPNRVPPVGDHADHPEADALQQAARPARKSGGRRP